VRAGRHQPLQAELSSPASHRERREFPWPFDSACAVWSDTPQCVHSVLSVLPVAMIAGLGQVLSVRDALKCVELGVDGIWCASWPHSLMAILPVMLERHASEQRARVCDMHSGSPMGALCTS
jgi:hypothetical protein